MEYEWSHHALRERLPERSSMTKEQIEARLDERRYVLLRSDNSEEHHLIWDEGKERLIAIPLILSCSLIPSVIPTDNGYAEYQRAEAERAWRGDSFYREPQRDGEKLCEAEVILSKCRMTERGYHRHSDLSLLLSWFVYDSRVAKHGDEGVIELFRDRLFCRTVKSYLEKSRPVLGDNERTFVHIKKPGAHRHIPVEFFLGTP